MLVSVMLQCNQVSSRDTGGKDLDLTIALTFEEAFRWTTSSSVEGFLLKMMLC